MPAEYGAYLRGRSRQAVRTNVARARAEGIRCTHTVVSGWTPLDHGQAPAAPAERWQARDRAGVFVGEAWLTIDDDCALMHSLATTRSGVRWLLHTAIVEDLCDRGCGRLLTNSHDAFLMPAGQQYFQHLLGYSIGRVHPSPRPSPRTSAAGHRLAALLALASAAAVGQWTLASVL